MKNTMKNFTTNEINKELENIKIICEERRREIKHFIKVILNIYQEIPKGHTKNPLGNVKFRKLLSGGQIKPIKILEENVWKVESCDRNN